MAGRRERRVHGLEIARRSADGDFAGRIADRVEHMELRPVVFGDRGEVFIKGELQQLERVHRFLRTVDEDQEVSRTDGLPQALEGAVEGDDGGAQARSAWSTRAVADWR